MADEKRKDKDTKPADPTIEEPQAQDATPEGDVDSTDERTKDVRGYLEKLFPGHTNEAFYALVGLVVAILFLIFGFWRMLLICFMVLCGIAFGQYVDGDPKIINTVKKWFSSGDQGQ